MSLIREGKFTVKCTKCGYQGTNMLHKCETYEIRLDDEILKVWATHPEHACEILANHVSKEIYVELNDIEYMVERIEGNYVASIAFEKKV